MKSVEVLLFGSMTWVPRSTQYRKLRKPHHQLLLGIIGYRQTEYVCHTLYSCPKVSQHPSSAAINISRSIGQPSRPTITTDGSQNGQCVRNLLRRRAWVHADHYSADFNAWQGTPNVSTSPPGVRDRKYTQLMPGIHRGFWTSSTRGEGRKGAAVHRGGAVGRGEDQGLLAQGVRGSQQTTRVGGGGGELTGNCRNIEEQRSGEKRRDTRGLPNHGR